MAEATIAVMPGDGIGPEVTAAALEVLEAIVQGFELSVRYHHYTVGASGLEQYGVPLRPADLAEAAASDAVLFGAVGTTTWDAANDALRPEQAILTLRRRLDLYANVRPIKPLAPLADVSSIKPHLLQSVDILFVREATGGLYFGKPQGRSADGTSASDTMHYTTPQIDRVVRRAFRLACENDRSLTSVDKANILATSRLWRERVALIEQEFPAIRTEHMLVDTCAYRLMREPRHFGVVVTENTFGDILTEEASVLVGSLAMLPSMSVGDGGIALYEPVHGSAPDIAGKQIANPIGAILSVALMLRYSLNALWAAEIVERAVESVLQHGARTADIGTTTDEIVGTQAMGRLIRDRVVELIAQSAGGR